MKTPPLSASTAAPWMRLPGEFETSYPEPEGWFHVVNRSSPDGIIVFRNIMAGKQAASALIQSEKLAAVGCLASSIAHEINNPLEAVTNLLYLARMEDDVPQMREYLDTAKHELHRVLPSQAKHCASISKPRRLMG